MEHQGQQSARAALQRVEDSLNAAKADIQQNKAVTEQARELVEEAHLACELINTARGEVLQSLVNNAKGDIAGGHPSATITIDIDQALALVPEVRNGL